MALNTNKNVNVYYSIKEVAAMFDIRESTLRFWETEFPHLKPKTVGQNVRQYTEKDIEQIRVIHNLVKVRGFKLAAARKMLTEDAPMFAGPFDANPYSQEAVRQYSKLLNIASAGDIDLLCNRAVHWWPDASLPEHAREEEGK